MPRPLFRPSAIVGLLHRGWSFCQGVTRPSCTASARSIRTGCPSACAREINVSTVTFFFWGGVNYSPPPKKKKEKTASKGKD